MYSFFYFGKSLFEVEIDIFLVGKGEEVKASIHDFNGEIHLTHPLNDGKFVQYQRALVRGQMIHSKSYRKVTRRNTTLLCITMMVKTSLVRCCVLVLSKISIPKIVTIIPLFYLSMRLTSTL